MGVTLGIEGNIADHSITLYLHDVDGTKVGVFFCQNRSQVGKLTWFVGNLDADSHSEIAVGFQVWHRH